MKKNLLTVVTFALVLVNLVLTAVLAIAVVPETQKANALISKVADAIDLELESGNTTEDTQASVSLDQLDVYNIADSMTINLKKGEDGQSHFAMLSVSLSINKKSDSYKTYFPEIATYESLIKTEINNVVSQYTMEEIQSNQQGVQDAIKKDLSKMFGDDFIYAVGFSSATYQ